LNPQGEILVVLMIEDTQGIANLPDILKQVPGVGMILVGEGDLSQELGCPREYDNPRVLEGPQQVVMTCKEHNVPVGHPHVDSSNIERILSEGYSFLLAAPTRSYAALDKGRLLTGRK
jgi:4-hydroxy-2-oxoheptanedioate aldolase